MRTMPASTMLAMTLALTGCATGAESTGICPEGSSFSPTGSSPGIRIVAERLADMQLLVSNQSFDDPTVDLTVSIEARSW